MERFEVECLARGQLNSANGGKGKHCSFICLLSKDPAVEILLHQSPKLEKVKLEI